LPALTIKSNLSTAAKQNDAANQQSGIGHHIPLGNNGSHGEITARNSQPSVQAFVQRWVDSPGHAAIMFDPKYKFIGGSVNGEFSTADFA
jgi:uncharacterized protein YkwD